MQRFYDKIEKTDYCWNWTGGSRGNGYGAIKFRNKIVDSHRVSYILHKGEIPEGMCVCHTCDNGKCVNPDHLFLGTHSDNMKDAFRKGRVIPPLGKRFKKGNIPYSPVISPSKILEVKEYITLNYPNETLISIAKRFNVSYQAIRDMRKKNSHSYQCH